MRGTRYPYRAYTILFIGGAHGGAGIIVFALLGERRDVSHVRLDLSCAQSHISARIARGKLPRVRQRGGNQRAIVAREVSRALAEVVFGASLDAVYAVAHFDGVEINLHDALLAPKQFDEGGEINLETFAHPRPPGPQKNVLGRLLRDGARAIFLGASGCQIALGGGADGLEVETMMKQKAGILAGHHGHGDVA